MVQSLAEYLDSKKLSHLSEIEISVGELMNIEMEILTLALKDLIRHTSLEYSSLKVVVEKAAFRCRKCSNQWGLHEVVKQLKDKMGDVGIDEPEGPESPLHFFPQLANAFATCPRCDSVDFLATAGNHVRITKIVMEKEV